MRKYENLTDQQLLDKIAAFDAAIEAYALGGGVQEVAGEGRRMKIGETNVGLARGLRDEYQAEYDLRYPPESFGRAIGVVVFGR